MSWTEIVAWLRATGNLTIENETWCGLKITLDGQPRKVAVKLAANEPSLIVSAQVCPLANIDPLEALHYNGVVEHWSLVVERGYYSVRRTIALRGLEWAELSYFIHHAASEAARLHRRQVGRSLSREQLLSQFAHWCDA